MRGTQIKDMQLLEVRGQGPTERAHTGPQQSEDQEVALVLRQVLVQVILAPSLGRAGLLRRINSV